MSLQLTPGQRVAVEISAPPTNTSAVKTLKRVLGKDPVVLRAQRVLERKRPSLRERQRGGRMWKHRMRSISPVNVQPGARYTVLATLDVIRDLESVARFIRVSPA